MRNIFTFFFWLVFSTSFAQLIDFGITYPLSNAYDITLDNNDNIIYSGAFVGEVDLNPGIDENIHVSNGLGDSYIVKVDNNGNYIWSVSFGNDNQDRALKVLIDSNDNVYVFGDFSDIVDFDSSENQFFLDSNDGNSYLLKLDSNGNFIWAKNFGGTSITSTRIMDVGFDNDFNIFISGHYYQEVDFDPSLETTYLLNSNNDSRDVFLLKLDSSGNFEWVNGYGSDGWENVWSLMVDNESNIIINGSYENSINFSPNQAPNIHTSNGEYDAFLVKCDNNGNYVWSKTIGGVSFNDIYQNVIQNDDGDFIVSGTFSYDCDMDPSEGVDIINAPGNRAFIQKFDSQWNYLFTISYGDSDINGIISSLSIEQAPNGDYIVVGIYDRECDFDPGINQAILPYAERDNFIQRFDSNFNLKWVYGFGEESLFDNVFDYYLDDNDNLYVAGRFENDMDFDFTEDEYIVSVQSVTDSYIFKYNLGYESLSLTEDVNTLNKTSLYPNPVKSEFSIRVDNPITTWSIINLLGQDVTKKIKLKQVASIATFNVDLIERGLYILKANDSYFKFIKN